MTNKVITISRQYGSGGRELGEKLGKELGLKVYDSEILALIAEDCQYDFTYVSDVVEQMKSIAKFDVSSFMGYSMQASMNQDNITGEEIFNSQIKVIENLSKEPCIIIGRCADYILREKENVINIFVYGSIEKRCKRIMQKLSLDYNEALELIKKYDKFRSKYYNYYCERKWGDPSNYHIMLNTDLISIDQGVKALKSL